MRSRSPLALVPAARLAIIPPGSSLLGRDASAGLRCGLCEGSVHPGERIVLLVSGHGLKDVDSDLRGCGEPVLLEPDERALQRAVGLLGLR